jgi:hypothetical protein
VIVNPDLYEKYRVALSCTSRVHFPVRFQPPGLFEFLLS